MRILLADDDADDWLLFQDALDELSLPAVMTTVSQGQQLMDELFAMEELPDVVFLDVNMPRKNGQDCLKAIRKSKKLQYLPVIIISTHYDNKMADALYKNGAHFFIKKPDNLPDLKILIREALQLLDEKDKKQPGRNRFVLNRELKMKPDFN